MTFTANVTGDRTICVVADGGLEVASDVAGEDPFREAGGNVHAAACDAALESLGFRRTGEWRPYAGDQGGFWTAEVVQDERLRFQAALHRMRAGFLGAKDRLEELAGFQSAAAENGCFFDGYRDAKSVFGVVLLQRDAAGRAHHAEPSGAAERAGADDILDQLHKEGKRRDRNVPEFDVEETLLLVRAVRDSTGTVFVTEAQAEAARMLVERDKALGREPDPAVLKIASAAGARDLQDEAYPPHHLLGKPVRVVLNEDDENAVSSGVLLGAGQGGDIEILENDGMIHYCWPALRILPRDLSTDGTGWAKIKRRQARDADGLAAVASGIGEHGIANACYRLAGILRRQAEDLEGGS
jgi:hypothetical protein